MWRWDITRSQWVASQLYQLITVELSLNMEFWYWVESSRSTSLVRYTKALERWMVLCNQEAPTHHQNASAAFQVAPNLDDSFRYLDVLLHSPYP
jgi:hypothetical protein